MASYLVDHGADVTIKNNVSTATCGLAGWLAVMVEMAGVVGCSGTGSGSGVLLVIDLK